MENKVVQEALQSIYDELERAKDLNGEDIFETKKAINNALSSLMEITEELDIEIII